MLDASVWEAFNRAVDGMATSPDTLRRRLADAYISGLMHIEDDHLPEEIRSDFKELAAVFGDGPAQAATAQLSDQQG